MVAETLPKVLLIEDAEELALQLQKRLEKEGFTTDLAHDGATGSEMLERFKYDVVVVDWELPGMAGPEIIESFRSSGGVTPMLMLTGKGELADKTVGFRAGADDYLTKPFSADELMLRLKALLRRAPAYRENTLKFENLTLNSDAAAVSVGNHNLSLQRLEFRLLEFFLQNLGRPYTAEAILDRVWPADSEASIETVRGYIKTLRKKLSDVDGPAIQNIYGLGYKIGKSEE